MRSSNFWLCLFLAPLLVSCAATRKVTVLEAVGPAPLRANGMDPVTEGALEVYSLKGIYNDQGVHYHPHTDYTIYSSGNQRLKEVKNALFPQDEQPVAVKLATGSYLVEALADGYERVRIPVVIEAGRLTTLYLESSKRPLIGKSTDWVRLSGGNVVGWRVNLAALRAPGSSNRLPGE